MKNVIRFMPVFVLFIGLYLTISNNLEARSLFYDSTTITDSCNINSFTADPMNIIEGGSTTISWSTAGCSNVDIMGITSTGDAWDRGIRNDVNNSVLYGLPDWNFIYGDSGTYTFTLRASDYDGNTTDKTIYVYVNKKATGSECDYIKGSYIKVVSPNGGEVYQAGQQVEVKWKTCNIPKDASVKLGLIYNGAGGGSAGDMYLSNLSGSQNFINDGHEIITIPGNFPWMSLISGKFYTLSAEYNSSSVNIVRDTSDDTFTINTIKNITSCESVTDPWIKVLLPNGGETYQAGQQIEVKWETCNISLNDKVDILVAHFSPIGGGLGGSNYVATLTSNGTINDGTENVILPTQYSGRPFGKNFKILVVKHPYSVTSTLYDASDNLFTIINNVQPPTPSSEKILFLGGINQNNNNYFGYNDIFSSDNMQSWNLISPNSSITSTKFSQREKINALYFNNKYWVIGGVGIDQNGGNISANNVWASSDGINWVLTASNPPFQDYFEYKAVVLNNKIYVVGGVIPGAGENQPMKVWSSSDGINWTIVINNADFGTRQGEIITVFNGQMYVIGGYHYTSLGTTIFHDVWSSSNGYSWTQLTDNTIIDSQQAEPVVFNGKMYLIGGYRFSNGGPSTDVYVSSDGVTWSLISNNLPNNSAISDAIVANDRIWIGDMQLSQGSVNHLWSSSDGITWTQSSITLPWSPRQGYSFINNISYSKLSSSYSTYKTINRTLRVGSIGDDVKQLQTILGIKADGKFGRGTAIKLKEWQSDNNLKPDGVFGKASWSLIK